MRRDVSVWLWSALVAGVVYCSVGVSGATAAATPLFTPVPGSPFSARLGASSVTFSPSGELLAFADPSGTTVATIAPSGALSPVSVSPAVSSLEFPRAAFSSDGQLLATTDLEAGTVSVAAVSAAGMLAPAPGSPFPVGGHPTAIAFSPSGDLLAVLTGGGQVSMFSVSPVGALSPVPGSPFQAGTAPSSMAFSPDGSFLAVTDSGSGAAAGSISAFSVAATGALSSAPVSWEAAGAGPTAVAFAPDGDLLAVANIDSNSVSMFSFSATGALAAVPGSPFSTSGSEPDSVAFSPHGGLVAVADDDVLTGPIQTDDNLEVFAASPAGALSPVPGSPFTTGPGPLQVAFSPDGLLLATADFDQGQVSVSAATPSATISSPTAGHYYRRHQHVAGTFGCQENPLGPGIASCVSSAHALINTGTLGAHTFSVTASSMDGLSTTTTVSYTVVLPIPRNTRRPVIQGRARVGARLRCTTGEWNPRDRSRYGYRWYRDKVPISGATTHAYTIRTRDRGKALTCVVTAANSTGRGHPATSNRVHVPRTRPRHSHRPGGG